MQHKTAALKNNTIIYPNPADDFVYVLFREDKYSNNCEITLYSTYGQKISTTNTLVKYYPSKGFKISVQHLPAGLYLLRVAYSDKVETHKLIVE